MSTQAGAVADIHPGANPLTQFLRRPMNWFLLFVPITVALEHIHGMPAPVLFFSAAVAIVPIASLIVSATEQLSTRTGDAIGGLLNATFGNAPELIIALVALKAGLPTWSAPRSPAPSSRTFARARHGILARRPAS
jgi:Ca2+:H+ antiporter